MMAVTATWRTRRGTFREQPADPEYFKNDCGLNKTLSFGN